MQTPIEATPQDPGLPAAGVPRASSVGTLDDVFAPPGEAWLPVSPKYRAVKQLSVVASYGPLIVAAVVPLVIFTTWWIAALVGGLIAAFAIYRFFLMDALVKSWGYAERENDLFIRNGLMFRNLTVVPYGRMQVIEVTSGPVQRHFGLAQVQLVTASASTNATIPGLETTEAARLRDRLSSLGESQAAGL